MRLFQERSVNCAFWEYALEEGWTMEEKLVFMYLITNEDTPPPTYVIEVSAYEIRYETSLKIISENTGFSVETVKRALDSLSKVHGKVHFRPTDDEHKTKHGFGIVTIIG